MKAKCNGRCGVFAEHESLEFSGIFPATLRMTIPAREAIESVMTRRDESQYYFTDPPVGIVVVLAPPTDGRQGLSFAVRMNDEPEYPGERPNTVDTWMPAMLIPCPKCGKALVWYESGYVPGYRVCCGPDRHHVELR